MSASPSIRVELAPAQTPSPRNGAPSSGKKGKEPKRRVKFGVPLNEALRDNCLPAPLVEMLVYIAQEGVTTTDLFRRPGNTNELKYIIARLAEGRDITLNNYNFYTLASVIKKFLLKIPGGIFGEETEKRILKVLEKNQRIEQYDYLHSIISRLHVASQQLLALLFGTWFRIVNHSEFNAMSSEAVAKSVAGSLFHTCAEDPRKIDQAVQVLQIMIDDFGVANLFGRKNIQYFADMTRTGIRMREKFRYEYRYPAGESTGSSSSSSSSAPSPLQLFALLLQQEAALRGFDLNKDAITEEEFYGALASRRSTAESAGALGGIRVRTSQPPSPQSLQPAVLQRAGGSQDSQGEYHIHKKLQRNNSTSAPAVNEGLDSPTRDLYPARPICTSLSRFDNVKKRQMIRMKKRSNWFLSGSPQGRAGSQESTVGMSVGPSDPASSSDDALLSDMSALSDSSPLSARRHHQFSSLPRPSQHRDGSSPLRIYSPNTNNRRSPRSPLAHRHQHQHQDIVNWNHSHTTTAIVSTSAELSSPSTGPQSSGGPSPLLPGDRGLGASLVPPWDSSSPSQSRSPSPQPPVQPHVVHAADSTLLTASPEPCVASVGASPAVATMAPTPRTVVETERAIPALASGSASGGATSKSSSVASTYVPPAAHSQVISHDITSEHQVRCFMVETCYGSGSYTEVRDTATHS